jgi:hypothetical protein
LLAPSEFCKRITPGCAMHIGSFRRIMDHAGA